MDNTYNSVAVDKSIIPEGSRLLINGTEYIANDVGGEINGKDIDIVIYDTPHEVVYAMGHDDYDVYLIVERYRRLVTVWNNIKGIFNGVVWYKRSTLFLVW